MYSRAIAFTLLCWTCHLQGLSGKKPSINVQKYLTHKETFPEIMKSVSAGTKQAIETCKHIFRNEIWNCHVQEEKIKNLPVFVRNILPANKEGAFLQSLGSAGVMYTLTLACRQGKFEQCGCVPVDRPPKNGQNWRWFGCNENVKFGEALTMKFMDELEKEPQERKALNLHNNNVGRKIVKMAARKLCRCHGPTGSCALKTCYRELLPFSEVGKMLKDKYDTALRVQFINNKLAERARQRSLHKKSVDMVYYDHSPDYCEVNSETKYPGMAGRKCSTEDQELYKCERPCQKCGMRIKKSIKSKQEKCQCKFHWCCRVECQMCEVKFTVTSCIK